MDSLSTVACTVWVAAGVQVNFGERVRELRKKQGLSQEAFAHVCGVDRTYMSGVERGRRNPTLKIVALIAKKLDITLSKLFDGVQV